MFTDQFIEEINNLAKSHRKEAVEKLIDEIAEDDGMIGKFVCALSEAGEICTK